MFGHKSIHELASIGDIAGIRDKIDRKKNLDKRDSMGRTASMLAAENGHHDIVELLERNGATVDAPSRPTLAHVEMIPVSSSKNSLPKTRDLEGVTSWLENGGDIEQKDKKGLTALMIASSEGLKDVVEYVVTKGADIEAKDKVCIIQHYHHPF